MAASQYSWTWVKLYPIAFSFGPFQDLAEGRYVWRLSLSEETDADWTAAFNLIR